MDERYLIISSDCHAGLPCEEYRPYLDPAYLDAFDDFLAERAREPRRGAAVQLRLHPRTGRATNEEGLRGAFDREQRDKELDADGVSGEVMFADSDAITGHGVAAVRRRTLGRRDRRPRARVRRCPIAHNRFLADLVAQSPARRGGVALVPVSHDVERGVREIEWPRGARAARV